MSYDRHIVVTYVGTSNLVLFLLLDICYLPYNLKQSETNTNSKHKKQAQTKLNQALASRRHITKWRLGVRTD